MWLDVEAVFFWSADRWNLHLYRYATVLCIHIPWIDTLGRVFC